MARDVRLSAFVPVAAFSLPVPTGTPRRLAIAWTMLALASLILGGVLTVLIVLSRTPGIQQFIPWIDFFHTAIVVHVDLTVLVWFLACAGIFWSLNSTERGAAWGWGAFLLACAGTAIFTAAPFLGAGAPLMNNYIPVLQDPIFLLGLSVVGAGITLLILRSLAFAQPLLALNTGTGALRFGLYTGALAALASVAALGATYINIPPALDGPAFYEILFWGAGHTLQFTHTQIMVVAWLWLASVSGAAVPLSPRVVVALLALGFAPVLAVPFLYLAYDVGSGEHILGFTRLMEWGGGISALPLGVIVLAAIAKGRAVPADCRPERIALLCSIALFAAGGIIGYLISGVNVTIPAHYHGSIVAVTLAFMGVIYHLLPRLGFEVPSPRLARIQPLVYGGGQLLHVLGLAWSGGYGVQRKTAGAAQGLHNLPEVIGMGLMGLGGLIAVIGGLMFLVVAIRAILPAMGHKQTA